MSGPAQDAALDELALRHGNLKVTPLVDGSIEVTALLAVFLVDPYGRVTQTKGVR